MNTIETQTKTTETHSISVHDDGRADGSVTRYFVTSRKLKNGKPFGASHSKHYPTADEAITAFNAR